jgi:hypothetical protein
MRNSYKKLLQCPVCDFYGEYVEFYAENINRLTGHIQANKITIC